MRVLIAGGGIGGLTLALCLHHRGIDCEVFESTPEIRPLGVGINVLPHSVRVLTLLGLADELSQTAIPTAELCYYSRHGQHIWAEPRGLGAGYRWPQHSIHRGELQMLLLRAVTERLGPASVHTGHHLTTFRDSGEFVEATFVDRRTATRAGTYLGDALVAADGIHSAGRASFYPAEAQPKFSGRLLWRSTTEAEPFLTGRSMVMAGHASQKFVAYPISAGAATRGRSLVNWIAELTVAEGTEPTRDWNREVPREKFLPAFESWNFDWLDIPAIIRNSGPIYEFPMSDRDPVDRWTFGRVTLLGDAAHPMYPIGSNGASQAILDAAALSEALHASTGDVPAALQRYEAQRLEPTTRIVLANRQQGPESVMQTVEERAPGGFANLHDVISQAELDEAAAQYKQVAGFDRETLNAKRDDSLA